MRRDSPLAQKEAVTPGDLPDLPLIVPRRFRNGWFMDAWMGKGMDGLRISATYSLLFNASLMVRDGMGYAICLDGIVNTEGDAVLCFRPLSPAVHAHMSVAWKKFQVFSKASEKFLEELRKKEQ
jgi:hypothetical protein